jgi:hypothetical protein
MVSDSMCVYFRIKKYFLNNLMATGFASWPRHFYITTLLAKMTETGVKTSVSTGLFYVRMPMNPNLILFYAF